MTNPNQNSFVHCPRCGKPSLGAATEKSFACRACEFVFFLNCAAAGMAVIVNEKNQLLATRRKHDPGKGTLDLPGGFAEPGEGIEQCIIREVKEELNLNVTDLEYLCSFPNTYPYESVVYPITDMAFVCEVKTFDTIDARDDISEFVFADLADLDTHMFGMGSARKVIEYYRKLSV